jgi:hypothetical protein
LLDPKYDGQLRRLQQMIRFHKRGLALLGTAVLTAATVGVGPVTANAQPRSLAAQTPYGDSQFLTYATGSQVHLAAVQTAASKLVGVEQAFSGISVNSGGLATALTDPATGALVQPALSSSKFAYGRGAGLEVGLGVPAATANQIKLGIAEANSPPVTPVVTKTVLPINLPGLLVAGVLKGIAGAAVDPNFCTLGQPLAYGEGDAAGVGLLGAPPLVSLSGTQTQTAQSQSRSDLVANSDGTFGLQSSVAEHIAPISVNLGTGLSIQISLGGSGVNAPITLTTKTDGKGHNSVALTNTGTLNVSLVAAGVTTTILNVDITKILPAGLNINANTLPIVGTLLSGLGITLSLTVAGVPHAIPGFPTGANAISGAYDLLTLNAGLGALQIAGLNVGHMQTGVDLQSGAIACTVPVAKVANPAVVTAGNSFTWTILVPASAAALAASTCDLTHIMVTDKISIKSGSPTFTVGTISNGGVYNTTTGTVSWPNVGNYHPGDPPIALTVNVSVPAGSPAGVLQDTANVSAGLGNCTGGATGTATAIGDISNVVIGGTITLVAPQVVSGTAGGGLATTGTGPLLPWLAAALLLVAEGTRRLVRRSRTATP